MPVNYQDIYTRVREIGAGARLREERLRELQERARDLLARHAEELDFLRRRVEQAREADPKVRCALPVDEPLDFSAPPPADLPEVTIIAADGSQINPDRHARVQFCVVNVGAITMRPGSGLAPEVSTDTDLLYGDELFPRGLSMTEAMVALRRDLEERRKLDELSAQYEGPIVTLTDGPVELWGASGADPHTYEQFVQDYQLILSRLAGRGVITAGYVDKPSADLVLRLLEIASLPEMELKRLRELHPLRGVSDRWLFGGGEASLLPPGHRSAVFGLQSGSDVKYTGQLSLHFFYLNAGSHGHPWPVRVELPRWVVDDRSKLDLLHSVLVQQCAIMGAKPYPYLLHRAHETAVVRLEEKDHIEQMLIQELQRQGLTAGEASSKQSAKDLPGRTRQ